jgi:branched-chain amino acid transport system permease protein
MRRRVAGHFGFDDGGGRIADEIHAGLGGALGAEILGLDPTFPLKFLIYVLIVVAVGGTSTMTGPFLAALLLGVGDVAGKYYVPKLGAFVIYAMMIVLLLWKPHGLFGRTAAR